MTDPYMTVCLVTPGGVVVKPFADGTHLTMRSCLGYLQAEDAVLAEMRAGHDPVPWASEAARYEAMASIRERGDLDEGTRADLLAWVGGTPYYADD
ncbi:MAG: hypothetical protein JJU07_16445 [Natronohydrobacter sp.]|nr:hypothetical protein [Natronohydrobacter sp.]